MRSGSLTEFAYLLFGLKSTYSKAWVELFAVEMKLKRRKTRSGTPRMCVSCLWMMCSLYDICCWVFLLNLYQPITFCNQSTSGKTHSVTWETQIYLLRIQGLWYHNYPKAWGQQNKLNSSRFKFEMVNTVLHFGRPTLKSFAFLQGTRHCPQFNLSTTNPTTSVQGKPRIKTNHQICEEKYLF